MAASHRKIAVLGLGHWGTALANHLATQGNDVITWTREGAIAAAIQRCHHHPKILTDIALHPQLQPTTDIAACSACDVLIYALPAATLGEIIPLIKPLTNTIFVSAVKGLESETTLTPLQFFAKIHGTDIRAVVLSGPSFALDVIHQRPCGLVAASRDEGAARIIAQLFSGTAMRVYTSADPIGVELGGVVKNVIALAAGVSDGLGLGESARAGLITRGLAEITRLAEQMGAERSTLSGLSGLGDLIMTATSPLSRNRTVGFRLGQGESLDQIVTSLGSVAEAVKSCPLIMRLARSRSVEMPICEQVEGLLEGKSNASQVVSRLLQRPLKSE